MRNLVVTRLAATVPVLVMVGLLAFALVHVTPVDPVKVLLGEGSSPEQRAALAAELGLDRPLVTQFTSWVGGAVRGDLGESLFTQRPVTETIAERLPVTLSLAGAGSVVALLIGLPIGVSSALRPGSLSDRLVSVIASLGLAVPSFWLALLLVLVFALQLGWLPAVGYVRLDEDPVGWARAMLLPAVSLGIHFAAVVARQMRSAMIDTLQAPYVQALRARGVPHRRIVWGYALKNAIVPVLAVIGLQLSVTVAVSFVIEKAFAIPGLGTLLIDAVVRGDHPVLQGTMLVVAASVLLINLAVDIVYGLVNPKVRPR